MSDTKKLYRDKVYPTANLALLDLAQQINSIAEVFGQDGWELIKTNFPEVIIGQDENGEDVVSPVFYEDDDDNGTLKIMAEHAGLIGSVAIVTRYSTVHSVPNLDDDGQRAGDPWAVPEAIYLLNMPKMQEVLTDTKLSKYREDLIARDLLARARKTAKLHAEKGAALITDRVSLLIAALGSGTGNKEEEAFRVMFPALQGIIIEQVERMAKRYQADKKPAKAREVLATYSKARLSRNNMKLCFSSATTAEALFPAMPQAQWENLLKLAIKSSASFRVMPIAKDENGNNLKDEEGKVIRREEYITLDPTIFHRWLDTRNETIIAEDEDIGAPVFDGLTLQAETDADSPASPATNPAA